MFAQPIVYGGLRSPLTHFAAADAGPLCPALDRMAMSAIADSRALTKFFILPPPNCSDSGMWQCHASLRPSGSLTLARRLSKPVMATGERHALAAGSAPSNDLPRITRRHDARGPHNR